MNYKMLSDFADVKGGKRLPKGSQLTSTPTAHPYIRVRDLNVEKVLELLPTYEYVDDETQKTISRYIVNQGDVVISIVGTIGLVSIIGKSLDGANLTENCAKLVNIDGLNKDFLYYYLMSEDGQNAIKAATIGAVQAKLPLKNIQALPIPELPINEQCAIANTLSALDVRIATNAKINHHLEQQCFALYRHFFVEKAMPEWESGTISDFGDVVGGSTPSKAKPEYFTKHGIAWITPKDLSVNKSKFIARGADDVTELGLRNSSARLMPRGTVLFSSRAPIGYIAIASGEVCTNQGFKSIVPKQNIGTAFVYFFLKDNLEIIESMASGSTFKEVSGATMKGIPAVIPDTQTLTKFNEACAPMFEQQELLEQENAKLAGLRDTLLPRLMSGELSVDNL